MLGFSIRKKPKNDPIFLETAKNFLKKSRSGFGTFLTPNGFGAQRFKKQGGVLKSMLTLNEAIIDVKEG